MADVTLEIGGRQYTVACRDGGEAHLLGLGRKVDAKVAEARGAVGNANEVRQLLFAALLLADDLAEASGPGVDPEIAAALTGLATRIESVADALESAPANA
jgi:cell division protein ZapA